MTATPTNPELTGNPLVLSELPTKVKVDLKSRSLTGSLLVDDVALVVNETSGTLPLPVAP